MKRSSVTEACKALLEEVDVTDISIQQVPAEDVIRNLFDSPKRGVLVFSPFSEAGEVHRC